MSMTMIEDAPIEHHTAADGLDQFIPIRKIDILTALIGQGAFASEGDRDDFRQLCRMLGSIYHYEYFELLEKLRDDYYYFNPQIDPHSGVSAADQDKAYDELITSFVKVLKGANFVEIPHAEIEHAHRRRAVLPVEVKAPLEDYREVRFFRRGHHKEAFELTDWTGLRKRQTEVDVYDDVVLFVAMKARANDTSKRELKRLSRRKLRPGSVMIKYFRNIASADLNALFPNVQVVMSAKDKLVLGLPALAGGIPILLNLYATITVLFLVVGFYLGINAAVDDSQFKTALAALTGLVALGGFIMRQFVKYQRQSLKYQKELTDNIYFRNINNNAGIFDYIIGAAEEQECKEAFLAYHFLHVAGSPLTEDELDGRIEQWLRKSFGVDLDFEVDDALGKLDRLGLLRRDGERLSVPPLGKALVQLDDVWDNFFRAPQPEGAAAE
jgi:hypothetical protein